SAAIPANAKKCSHWRSAARTAGNIDAVDQPVWPIGQGADTFEVTALLCPWRKREENPVIAAIRPDRIKDEPRIHGQSVKTSVTCLDESRADKRATIASTNKMTQHDVCRIGRLKPIDYPLAKCTP